MVNFYRRFIPHAALQQAELYDLVKNPDKNDSKPLQWNEITNKAFETCKDSISIAALLAHPHPDCKLALFVDAAGSVQQEQIGSDIKPLAFFSHRLTPTETRYSTYDRELLAENFVADAFSRISEIQIPNEINFAAMEEAQRMDKELEELKKNSSLSFKAIEFPGSNLPLYRDVSAGQVPPYVP
ncbi:hypothetical protein AVEN_270212-1 [Araneus ventricosus]|uniref:Reverse transcriptase/retrotransposon-derived protein RNase H-like domain-containing protein n=1 Tax=Araneus ventricosus TaxID=182803 RepID=A0A4Y2FXI3_ARAVE|nr:hypothetical protein AVEN_270212-1 [Araneus ventricosus]